MKSKALINFTLFLFLIVISSFSIFGLNWPKQVFAQTATNKSCRLEFIPFGGTLPNKYFVDYTSCYTYNVTSTGTDSVCNGTTTCGSDQFTPCSKGSQFECNFSCNDSRGQCHLVRTRSDNVSDTPVGDGSCDYSAETAYVCRGATVGSIVYNCNWKKEDGGLKCERTTGTKCAAVEFTNATCNGGNYPPDNGRCLNSGSNFSGQCISYSCGSGCDTNGRCGEGAATSTQKGDCAALIAACQGSDCCQVDAISDNGVYCSLQGFTETIRCKACGTKNPPPSDTPVTPAPLKQCGATDCTTDSDCQSGLTCQTVVVGRGGVTPILGGTAGEVPMNTRKMCIKNNNELCKSLGGDCCNVVTPTPTYTPTPTPTSTPTPPPSGPPITPGPMCASITLLDASNNNPLTGDADKNLKLGDAVRFKASATVESTETLYQFRVLTPSNQWIYLPDVNTNTSAKNVSSNYTITEYGKFYAQARTCKDTVMTKGTEGSYASCADDLSSTCYIPTKGTARNCEAWETIQGAPVATTCTSDSQCAAGKTCKYPSITCPTGATCAPPAFKTCQ